MLTASDLITLPCSPDLVESGIACACRSLAQPGLHTGASLFEHLRLTVADVAVELAFRRYLTETKIPFAISGSSPFTDPDHYDVSLGGHRCTLKTRLISHRPEISLLRSSVGTLLLAAALVPLEAFSATEAKPDDIQLFAFLLGLVTASHQELEKAAAAGQPLSLVHPLPSSWRRPMPWVPLENLSLKSECQQPLTVEIFGQDADRNFITRVVELTPVLRMSLPADFYSVLCLRIRRQPEARVGIHCPAHGEPYILQPFDWGNLWVYGMNILLTGWLTHENYRRQASVLNPGKNAPLVGHLNEKHLFVKVGELNPLTPLLHRVRDWAGQNQVITGSPQ